MKFETANILVAIFTYSVLSMMHDTFRRMLEQFFADEIFTAHGRTEESTRRAFDRRVRGSLKKEVLLSRALVYCFPRYPRVALVIVGAAVWLSWPVSLAISVGGYVIKANGTKSNMEICNDIDIRIKTGS